MAGEGWWRVPLPDQPAAGTHSFRLSFGRTGCTANKPHQQRSHSWDILEVTICHVGHDVGKHVNATSEGHLYLSKGHAHAEDPRGIWWVVCNEQGVMCGERGIMKDDSACHCQL